MLSKIGEWKVLELLTNCQLFDFSLLIKAIQSSLEHCRSLTPRKHDSIFNNTFDYNNKIKKSLAHHSNGLRSYQLDGWEKCMVSQVNDDIRAGHQNHRHYQGSRYISWSCELMVITGKKFSVIVEIYFNGMLVWWAEYITCFLRYQWTYGMNEKHSHIKLHFNLTYTLWQ